MKEKTNKGKIIEYLSEKKEATLKEIASECNININSVMGCINSSVLANKDFVKVRRGTYKLKGEEDGSSKEKGSDDQDNDEEKT